MPLHRCHQRAIGACRKAFDQAIWRTRFDRKIGCQFANSLEMDRIDRQFGLAESLCQHPPAGQCDRMQVFEHARKAGKASAEKRWGTKATKKVAAASAKVRSKNAKAKKAGK